MSMNKNKVISQIDRRVLEGVMHRGYHSKDVSENSLEAFRRAVEIGASIEFDVHITKDDELVVIHDEDLKRLTGKEGIVEDLTLKELKENYSLLDGQKIPSLTEVLDLVDERVPMLIELKVFRKNYKRLAKVFKEYIVKRIKDKTKYILISFDPRSLFPLKSLGLVRLLLINHEYMYVYNLFRFFFDGLDLEDVMFSNTRIQRYAKKHFMNVWTIESLEKAKELRPYVDTMTYQYLDPIEMKELLK